MRKTIEPDMDHEVLSLIKDVAYACVPAWYGATRRSLVMDIIAPKVREGHARQPLFIFLCGGAFTVIDSAVWIPELMDLARRGYTVASVQYRTKNEMPFPGPLEDVKAAIRYLKAHAKEYCIDPEKVVISGESAGGSLASLAGVTGEDRTYDVGDYLDQSSCVNAVVDIYGVVDFQIHKEGLIKKGISVEYLQEYLGKGYGQEEIEKASAVYHVTKNTPPFLILHGSDDSRVELVQSEKLYETLQENGVRSDLIVINGAEHGEDSFYQLAVMEMIDAFLKEVL